MLDRLIDLLSSWLGLLKFWTVVDAYERQVLLRWGKYKKVLEPGFHLIWPLADNPLQVVVVRNTLKLTAQNLTTADGHDIAVCGIVTFEVEDPRLFLLECEGGNEAIADCAIGTIGEWACANTREHVRDPKNWSKLESKVRHQAKAYGIRVLRCTFADNVRSKALRLLGSGS